MPDEPFDRLGSIILVGVTSVYGAVVVSSPNLRGLLDVQAVLAALVLMSIWYLSPALGLRNEFRRIRAGEGILRVPFQIARKRIRAESNHGLLQKGKDLVIGVREIEAIGARVRGAREFRQIDLSDPVQMVSLRSANVQSLELEFRTRLGHASGLFYSRDFDGGIDEFLGSLARLARTYAQNEKVDANGALIDLGVTEVREPIRPGGPAVRGQMMSWAIMWGGVGVSIASVLVDGRIHPLGITGLAMAVLGSLLAWPVAARGSVGSAADVRERKGASTRVSEVVMSSVATGLSLIATIGTSSAILLFSFL